MKQWLERKRLWVGVYVALDIISAVVTYVGVFVLSVGGDGAVAVFLLWFNRVAGAVGFVYGLYRLLYLYRGIPRQALWRTLAAVVWANVLLAWFGVSIPVVGGILPFVSLACIVHDIALVLG